MIARILDAATVQRSAHRPLQAPLRGGRSALTAALLALALGVLLALLTYQLWLSYRDDLKTAEMTTRNFAAIFEARLHATLRRTEADLASLATEIPLAALKQTAVGHYAWEVSAALDSRMFNMQEMTGYRVHDADGDALYASDGAHTQRVNVADRRYFQQLRDDPGSQLIFSEALSDRSTGRAVLVVVKPLRDPHGSFLGTVLGVIDLDYYNKQFQKVDLGPNSFIVIRRSDDHSQVLRWPESPGPMSQPLPPDHVVVTRLAAGERQLTAAIDRYPDNVARIVSVYRMDDYPFYLGVGLDRNRVLAGWRTQALVVGASTLLLFALFGFLLLRLRRMRIREAGILNNLEQSEAQYRELAKMVPVGICHLDRNGLRTYVNDRHLLQIGLRREDALGHHWSDLVHPDDRAKLGAAWAKKEELERTTAYEYRLLRPDGQTIHVIGDVQTELDSDGNFIGAIIAQTDITLRKQAEADLIVAKQQAEGANMAKTRFLAAASHDLRQPIQAINLFRDALLRTELSAEQSNIASFLSMSIHSLSELLYSLLDISKLEAGQIKPQIANVPVEDLFKAIAAESSTLARQKQLRFKLYYPMKGLVLQTDSGLLLSALRNLIDNAFKYTESGGVLVGARQRAGRGVIQVWDTGIGIDIEDGEKVFDECFQIDNPARDRTKGLGLGLSIARRTARLLGGDVTYRSQPGRGSVFEILQPLADPASSAPIGPPARELADEDVKAGDFGLLRGWRIAVVEDDTMVAKAIELSLQRYGMTVMVFQRGEDLLDHPAAMGADFFISDFRLPGINGLELLDAIQRQSAHALRAVLITGDTSPERIKLTAASPWPVLFKPADLPTLLVVMRASLDSQSPSWTVGPGSLPDLTESAAKSGGDGSSSDVFGYGIS